MKGYLDANKLKTMKYNDLQALAKEIGVSASGKTEEIIARIAAVEVDIPDESELTPEEKSVVEQAAVEESDGHPYPKDEQGEANAESTAKEQSQQVSNKVFVVVTRRYIDKQFNQIKEVGEVFLVDKARADELVAAEVAKIKE